MSEGIVVSTREYYEDLKQMGGDPTAGMDGSGDDPEFRVDAGAAESDSAVLAELDRAASEFAMRNIGVTVCDCVIQRKPVDRLRAQFFSELKYLNTATMEMTTEVEGAQ